MNVDFAERMTSFRCVDENGTKVIYFNVREPKHEIYHMPFSMDMIVVPDEIDSVIKSEIARSYAENINDIHDIAGFFDIKYELGKTINPVSLTELNYVKNVKCTARFENIDDLAKILDVSCIEEAFIQMDLLGIDAENMKTEIGKMKV